MHSTSPGALPLPPHVAAELRRAWEARAPDDLPRTRHLERDGSPTYTNRLLLETSPYLRQHAHNPVDWFPWGDEAFELARRLKRPVFLSVGYSTCHWCHVMEEESFEDLEVARFLNEHFVAVKVDREERPDVDAVYMAAVQAIAGQGGWPMSVFLTPDRKPFFGGTYFPARDGDRGAHTGFLTLMQKIQRVFDADPAEVIAQAEHAAEYLRGALAPQMAGDLPGPEVLERASAFFTDRYDPMWGGTRGSPKFPSHLPVRFLMGEHVRTGDPAPLEMATHTLRRMAAGGLRDHVGGGFHRYSVDHRWLVPHFEKMLYDNALLTLDHVDAWRLTGAPDFEALARETLAYVVREMTSPEGAFYSATDADSPVPGTSSSEEGWFFTWTPAEIHAVLDEGDARAVLAWYGVEPEGNFEGRSIPHTPRPADEVARELGLSVDRLEARITAARERLYDARAQRPPPLRDDKILAAWNGLMISAFARAAFAFGDPALARPARDAASFVLDRMRVDGRLRRTFKDGRARHEAMLEDYAFVVAGLLDLFEATWERRWFDEALAFTEVIEAHYADPQGGWFRTPDDGEALLAREKPDYDGAEPTGSSVHVRNLLRLSVLTTDDRHRQRADDALRAHARRIAQGALAEMLLAVQWRVGAPKEVAIVAPSSLDEAEPLLRELRTSAPGHRVVVAVTEADLPSLVSALPWLDGKRALQGRATAYVCERGTCQSPTSDPATLRSLLRG